MKILNFTIIIVLIGLIIRSLIVTVKEMDHRKKMITNGIIILFLSILILGSLISYSPKESFKENFGGVVGAFIAKSLYDTFGILSLPLPLILIIAAFALFKNNIKLIFYRIGGLFLGLFFISLMAVSLNQKIPTSSKGAFGTFISSFLISKLSLGGSITLLIFLSLLIFYVYLQPSYNIIKSIFQIIGRKTKGILPKKEEVPISVKEEEREEIEIKPIEKKLQKPSISIKEKTKEEDQEEFKRKFLDSLKDPVPVEWMTPETINNYKNIIEGKLKSFGITGKITGVSRGPVVSRFEFKPDLGIKLSKISNLANDIALALHSEKIRIIAPIPGKGVVGIEVPNKTRETVFLKELIENETFQNNTSITYVPIGKNITGQPFYYSIALMPHLLIAGATGSGKSVFINSIITSLLYKATPDDIRFILIDPKRIELSIYNGIPHLIRSVITEQSIAIQYLNKALECMEQRYKEFARVGVRDIQGYNSKIRDKKPYILIIIDELADLMMRSGREVENAVIRLAQMSRAVGIHLILATQRPSVDVITGLIKANFPARIAFQVASIHDSKTILDTKGAEKLLGGGDMLFIPPDEGIPKRFHGPLITTEETKRIVSIIGFAHLKNLLKTKFSNAEEICALAEEEEMLDVIADRTLPGAPERIEEFSKLLKLRLGIDETTFTEFIDNLEYYPPTEEIEEFLLEERAEGEIGELDELYEQAKEIIIEEQTASVSLLQRKLKIGYARAGRLIDQLEKTGVVGKFKGSKPREVLIKKER
ncbi:MAG: DNA translocase FtsK 4TM domain-containing protein [candidate division WOR-3 bacterium]